MTTLYTSSLVEDHDMIHISVVVPFHNSERYIAECIEGPLSQEYPGKHYEIIMVDNNSTDGSAEIIRKHSRIKLISEEKRGAYAARNRGLRQTKGEIVAFTDSDCLPSSGWLKEIESAMTDSKVGIVIGSHQLAGDSSLLSMLEDYEDEKNKYIFGSKIKELYYGYTRNMAVRRTLFDDIGLFVERGRGSDVIFVRRCVDKYSCDAVGYSPEIRVRHMEIDNLRGYFRKVFIYGGSSRKYSHIAHTRPLSIRERFLVFRRTAQRRRYSWKKSVFLFALLAVGLGYWIAGSLSSAWNLRQKL